MLLSTTWLSKYVELPEDIGVLETLLTNVGLEVESIEDRRNAFKDIVVGEVLTCEKHPNADKLSVCTVRDGVGEHTVVCGAPNVAAGQKVMFARVGAEMSELGFTIDRRKLRGVESAGMICSSAELGIDDQAEGIAVLDETAEPGTPLAKHLGYDDVVFGIGITPNRGDALSHVGSARDIAAATNRPLHIPAPAQDAPEDSPEFRIDIRDSIRCPRYSAAIIEGVTVQESPKWLVRALSSVGIRSINSIVDVTNFVMMEIGQPMHAFDLSQIEGDAIVVRNAHDGERFMTLDEEKRDLHETDLLICDARKPVAIAGVMGGLHSSVTESTTSILLESAHFNASAVRKTAKHLQLSTDSSYRFERGSDAEITVWALYRAAELITDIAGGTLRGVYDSRPLPIEPRTVRFRTAFTDRMLGIHIDAAEQRRILEALQFTVEEESDGVYLCGIPSFRSDIEREIDLVEEIARIHGYDNIPLPTRIEMNVGAAFDDQEFPSRLRGILLGLGYDEVLSSSLVPRAHAGIGDEGDRVADVLNPVSKERPSLRSRLLPSILEAVDVNIRSGFSSLKVFEIGSVFSRSDSDGYSEMQMLAFAVTGSARERTWHDDERSFDFYDLKGTLEALLRTLNLDNVAIFHYDRHSTLSEHVLTLEVKGRYAGQAVEVSDAIRAKFSIDQPVFYAELDVQLLRDALPERQMYTPIARYPSVTRDLAVLVSRDVRAGQIADTVRKADTGYLRNVRVVDVFTNESIGPDRKSIAFTMTFQSDDHTLKDAEVNRAVERIVQALQTELGAELRT